MPLVNTFRAQWPVVGVGFDRTLDQLKAEALPEVPKMLADLVVVLTEPLTWRIEWDDAGATWVVAEARCVYL